MQYDRDAKQYVAMFCDGAGSLNGVVNRVRIFGSFSSPVVGIGVARDKRT